MENGRRTIKKDLTNVISKIVSRLKINEPLKNHTTFKAGGPAKYFADIFSREELKKTLELSIKERLSLFVLGAGSNVLFSDEGFDGLVIRLMGDFTDFSFKGDMLCSGASVRLNRLIAECAKKGLSGLEVLSGIPASVGGAVMCNAGTDDGWISDSLVEVEVMINSGNISKEERKDIGFSYRSSNLAGKIILGAVFHLKKKAKNGILEKIGKISEKRIKNQPLNEFSAGCIFKNPKGMSAGLIIDEAGLRGLKFGGAKVSEKHANFIINFDNAKSSDIRILISLVHEKVKSRTGINLDLEIKVI